MRSLQYPDEPLNSILQFMIENTSDIPQTKHIPLHD